MTLYTTLFPYLVSQEGLAEAQLCTVLELRLNGHVVCDIRKSDLIQVFKICLLPAPSQSLFY